MTFKNITRTDLALLWQLLDGASMRQENTVSLEREALISLLTEVEDLLDDNARLEEDNESLREEKADLEQDAARMQEIIEGE